MRDSHLEISKNNNKKSSNLFYLYPTYDFEIDVFKNNLDEYVDKLVDKEIKLALSEYTYKNRTSIFKIEEGMT